ncbi:LLM class flavin-dependent oxidoreductase [bacterium]|nr:LLM class flavin-dependent oxidoreductase [bacterium]
MSGVRIGIGFGSARTGVPTPAQICAYAERAEDLGIDSIWLSDRVTGTQLDIACVMALVAARTTRIKMGPSVLTLPAHHPVHVARTYATLDHLSGGRRRIIMAVGIGNDPRQCLAAGVPAAERGARLEEGVAVLRKLWSGARVSHRGRFYEFDELSIEPRPVGGPLDVWIGGRSDVALRRVARYGDGWFPSFITAEEFRAGMDTLVAYGAEHGRVIDRREAGTVLLSYVTEDAARAAAVRELAAGAFGLPVEAMRARCAVGSAAECVERLRGFIAAGCTKFVLFPLCPPDELVPQIERYAARVLPACGG